MRRYQFKLWLYRNIWYPIVKFVLFFYPPACNWHKGDTPVNWDECPPSCPECGKLLDTKCCHRCGNEFLNFGNRFGDDIMGPPFCTSSGDLMCYECMVRYERDQEEAEEDEADYDYSDVSEAYTE